MKFLGPTERPRLNEVVALVMLLAGLCAILSLASYSPLDLSSNTVSKAAKPNNLLGEVGAYGADFALQVLGFAAYALPFALFSLGWKWVRSASIDGPGVKTFGFVLLLLAVAAAFGLWSEWHPFGGLIPASGLMGLLLAGFLVTHFNELGAWLLTMVAITLSLYLVSTFHIRMIGQWFAAPIAFFHRLSDRFADWRELRAERAATRREARVRAALEAAEAAALAQKAAANQTDSPVIKPRRARAAAVGANGSTSDSFTQAGVFPVPAAIASPRSLEDSQLDDEFEALYDDIPIRTIKLAEREEIPERKVAAMPASLAPDLPKPKSRHRTYTLPPTELLSEPPARSGFDTQELKDIAAKIKSKLEEFNVFGNVVQINPGPGRHDLRIQTRSRRQIQPHHFPP